MDDSIYQTSKPFSGPRGDYLGAARKAEYEETQRAVYTGYKKIHGLKVETVFLPNGLIFLFGPVSARRNDMGVLRMSDLSGFLVKVQHELFLLAGVRFYTYSVLGDSAFTVGYGCIQSYFKALGAHGQLTEDQQRCNIAIKSARITIEKNYGMTSTIFRICNSVEGFKLAKNRPYALEQLRICHLLTNCYICFNGDQAGHNNTFGINTPSIREYLYL